MGYPIRALNGRRKSRGWIADRRWSSNPLKAVIPALSPGASALFLVRGSVSPWSLPGVRSEKIGATANFPIASRAA